MTVIYGVFCSDSEACRIDLNSMMESDVKRITDITSSWHTETVSFGQKTLHITPESFLDPLPFNNSISNLCILGDIRLDNRYELFSKLKINHAKLDSLGDARLVLAAYEKWGESCTDHLLGDFCFVIWDGTNKKLICCNDHLNMRGLFYFYDGKKFIFASSPYPILQVHGVPNCINYNKLSTMVSKNAKHLFWEESWFENIYPLPAANVLTVDKNGIRKRRYWMPELGKELSFKNEDEYAEAFQEVIFKAVGDRMRSQLPVTALLSGGLDSSAVVSIAAKILEKQNRELQVLSSVLPNPNDPLLKDERHFIDQFRSFPNVRINYITAPGKGFLSNIEGLKTNIYAPNLTSSHYLYHAFASKTKELGSRVILDGGGGELGPTFHGNGIYAELFSKMQFQKLWHELYERRKLVGEPMLLNFKQKVLKPLIPEFLVHLIKSSQDDTMVHFIEKNLKDTLMQRLAPRLKDLTKHTISESYLHRNNQLNLIKLRQAKTKGISDFDSVNISYPLMDKRLLEFCLAAPLDYKIKNGYKRYLVRMGLDKILPTEIQWRNSKSPFSPDYNRRYKEQRVQAQTFLKSIGPNDPIRNIVDTEKLLLWSNISLADDEHGTFAEIAARDLVPQGIYLIHFLRRFKDFQV
jgi:asparagine synthase (glutamine-hydrolysing)